jgi:hypothetical protein
MSTSSDTTRAIDRKHTNWPLIALVVLTLALTTGCSMSLVDQAPEVLHYCRIADRSEPAGTGDAAGQSPQPADNAATGDCAGGADRVCDDDEIAEALASGRVVNCTS